MGILYKEEKDMIMKNEFTEESGNSMNEKNDLNPNELNDVAGGVFPGGSPYLSVPPCPNCKSHNVCGTLSDMHCNDCGTNYSAN